MRIARWMAMGVLAATGVAVLVHADPVMLPTTEMGAGPTIVFVGNLGLGRLDWLPTAKRLREHYHVVLADLPGHGGAAMPDPFTFEAAAAAIDGVLAKQKAESTVVVAQGMGGLLALMALGAHPDHAAGLVMLDAPVRSVLAVSDQQREQFVKFIDENYDAFAQMAFHKMGRDSAESERLYAGISTLAPTTVKGYFKQMLGADATGSLKLLRTPAVIVVTDRIWKPGMSQGTVLKQLGYADTALTVRRMHDAGALVMRDQPDSLAAVIGEAAARILPAKH